MASATLPLWFPPRLLLRAPWLSGYPVIESVYESSAARDVLSPAGSPRHEAPVCHARTALHRCLGEGTSYVAGNLSSRLSNSRGVFSRGRAALLSRASSTSFMAAPPLAASVQACTQGLTRRISHAG